MSKNYKATEIYLMHARVGDSDIAAALSTDANVSFIVVE